MAKTNSRTQPHYDDELGEFSVNESDENGCSGEATVRQPPKR